MEELDKEDIRAFQNSIGVTTFSRIALSIHKTMAAVWYILSSPFAVLFDYTPHHND